MLSAHGCVLFSDFKELCVHPLGAASLCLKSKRQTTNLKFVCEETQLGYVSGYLNLAGCSGLSHAKAPKARLKVARHAAKQVPGTARFKASPARDG